jgi:hypothetical protein
MSDENQEPIVPGPDDRYNTALSERFFTDFMHAVMIDPEVRDAFRSFHANPTDANWTIVLNKVVAVLEEDCTYIKDDTLPPPTPDQHKTYTRQWILRQDKNSSLFADLWELSYRLRAGENTTIPNNSNIAM